MPLNQADKPVFRFNAGLFTEGNPLNQPEGTTLDERNFDILLDGSRRRRRGVARDGGITGLPGNGELPDPNTMTMTRIIGAGGHSGLDLIVLKHGSWLHWWKDIIPWGTQSRFSMQLVPIDGASTSDIASEPVSLAVGNGQLYVSGKYIETFKLDFQSSGAATSAFGTVIDAKRRWYEDFEDGIPVTERPESLDPAGNGSHEFNLLNRGWTRAEIDDFNSNPPSGYDALYPSKADLWWKAYARTYPSWDGAPTHANIPDTREEDWEQTFKAEKLYLETFGNESAPRGALITGLYDTTAVDMRELPLPQAWNVGVWNEGAGRPFGIGGTVPVGQFGFSPDFVRDHGFGAGYTGNIQVVALRYQYYTGTQYKTAEFSGTIACLGSDVNSLYFEIPQPGDASGSGLSVKNKGVYYDVTDNLIPQPPGYQLEFRAQVNAFYAGRLWLYSEESPIGSLVFFSQIATEEGQDSKFYQDGDPTSENRNQLQPNDGGFIEISGLHGVKDMRKVGSSLLIFAQTGIWEIRGGQGFFSATDYSVRKISEADCLNSNAIANVEGMTAFASSQGIYVISPDEQTGQLVARSITEQSIESLWQDRDDFPITQTIMEYDSYNKRLHVMCTDGTNYYKHWFYFDVRLRAWSRHSFEGNMMFMFPSSDEDGVSEHRKMMWLAYNPVGGNVWFCSQWQDAYVDFEQTYISYEHQYDSYLLVGHDNTGDWQRRKKAPYIHTYMQKTETGYTQPGGAGTELIPVNESDLTVQARWDWADHANAGKFSSPQQAYKHRRLYSPVDLSDNFDNGHPVIVARHKLRGTGRALQLYFFADGTLEKPAHLLGWAINYASRRRL